MNERSERTMSDETTVWHQAALDFTGGIVNGIDNDNLDDPTPCDGWDVRALLNHVVAGNWWAARLVAGQTIADVGSELDGDLLGADPAAAFEGSAAAAAAAFGASGAMDAPCAVSYGPIPGSLYAMHRTLDVSIHGWDLAAATHQPTALPPDLVAALWESVQPELGLLRGSGMFGADVPIPDDADLQSRLLMSLGRQPSLWSAE